MRKTLERLEGRPCSACETLWKHGSKVSPDNFTSENIPPSTIPTQQPLPRTTVKTSAELRNTQPDELEQFLQQDALFISTFHQELEEKIERNSNIGYLSWGHDNQTFSVFSKVRKGPIHSFSIYFTLGDIKNGKISSLYYESYVNLKRVKLPQFDKIKGWEMYPHCPRNQTGKCTLTVHEIKQKS